MTSGLLRAPAGGARLSSRPRWCRPTPAAVRTTTASPGSPPISPRRWRSGWPSASGCGCDGRGRTWARSCSGGPRSGWRGTSRLRSRTRASPRRSSVALFVMGPIAFAQMALSYPTGTFLRSRLAWVYVFVLGYAAQIVQNAYNLLFLDAQRLSRVPAAARPDTVPRRRRAADLAGRLERRLARVRDGDPPDRPLRALPGVHHGEPGPPPFARTGRRHGELPHVHLVGHRLRLPYRPLRRPDAGLVAPDDGRPRRGAHGPARRRGSVVGAGLGRRPRGAARADRSRRSPRRARADARRPDARARPLAARTRQLVGRGRPGGRAANRTRPSRDDGGSTGSRRSSTTRHSSRSPSSSRRPALRRGSRSRTSDSRPSSASSSTSSAARAPASSVQPMKSAGGSSATSTTSPNSGCSAWD